ncbi:MAG: J domain-containing protein, partial [Spirulinaceae cyanobacterium SM2_1_0]|nr:J domain-containing protein [Spirulinaceae cyanobacterium SM2_1_0]
MSNPFERYYQVLGLEPGASWDEVNQAYKDLAFVWHPDRLPRDNPRLLEKAAARLKAINEAREHLRSHHEKITNSTRPAKSAPPTSATPPRPNYYDPQAANRRSSRAYNHQRSSYGNYYAGGDHTANNHSSNAGHASPPPHKPEPARHEYRPPPRDPEPTRHEYRPPPRPPQAA